MNVPLQNYGVEAVEHVSIASNEWSNQNINPEEQNQAPNVQVQKSSPMRRLHLDTTSNQPYVDVNHLAPGSVVPLNQGNLASTVSQNQALWAGYIWTQQIINHTLMCIIFHLEV